VIGSEAPAVTIHVVTCATSVSSTSADVTKIARIVVMPALNRMAMADIQ
jgi:hypothetical protein